MCPMPSIALRFCLLALIAVTSVNAQTLPTGRAFPILTWPTIITGEVGTQQSLGYEPLHVAVGVGLERRLGKWLELDPSVSWSPDRSVITHDGDTVSFRAEGIMWSGLRQTLGLAGGFTYVHVWTSQFSQSGFSPRLGMAARLHVWTVPSRLYLSYVVPYSGYDVRTGLENSRSQGPEAYFEGQLTTRFRLGLELAAYHFFSQSSSPSCDVSSPCYGTPACSGPGRWGGAAALVLRLTPRQSTRELY
jgi:hypothetical protein